jgi:protein phosphatase
MSLPTPWEPVAAMPSSGRAVTTTRIGHGRLVGARARLDLAAASARGRRHEVNEDAHSALDTGAPLFVVADGVGGGAMASRASRALVARLHAALGDAGVDEPALAQAVLEADRAIALDIAAQTTRLGAATFALCAGVDAMLSQWLVAWVGDCRVYRIAAGDAELLTWDDSYRHLGEPPPPGGSPDDPARMVGNGAVTHPNVVRVALGEGELLALCSDGVHRHVQARELGPLFGGGGLSLARRCARAIALARGRGSSDDATILVLRRAASAPPREGRSTSGAAR